MAKTPASVSLVLLGSQTIWTQSEAIRATGKQPEIEKNPEPVYHEFGVGCA